VAYDFSDYADDLSDVVDRNGRIFSARLYTPDPFIDKLTHAFRAAYGIHEISDSDLDYTLTNFQYSGTVRPHPRFQFKYGFFANRVDNESTDLKTDNFRNSLDATVYHEYGRVFGGYTYETNDDDRTLTSFDMYRVGAVLRGSKASIKINYANRNKKDLEELTLLKESESQTFSARGQLQVSKNFVLGGRVYARERELPDIGVEIDGRSANVFARYSYESWGSIGVDYTRSSDEYDDRVGRFDTESNFVTSRAEFTRLKNLRLAGGATLIDIEEDLDIEKSVMFVEADYTIREDYHLEVRYNVYNYDDYILLDRYYTANVVWLNVAYDFRKD
jgi:hypothetical protein